MQVNNFNTIISGISLLVKEFNPDDPVSDQCLILLHDALGSIAQWRDFPERLAFQTGCRVLVYDRPLHGKSGSASYDSVKEQFDTEKVLLNELLLKLGIKLPGLIGVSDGATISLNYATTFPCSFVIAMAPHVIMEEKILAGIEGWMLRRNEFEEKLTTYHDGHTGVLIDQWYKLWKVAGREGWDMTEWLEKIDCPVTLIQDPQDPFGSLVQINSIKSKVKDASIELLQNAGHFPYITCPEKVIEITKSLLGR